MTMIKRALVLTGLIFLSSPVLSKPLHHQKGVASYYHSMFEGRKTANGERFSNKHLTAAHRTLPLGSKVKVTNLSNQKSIVVRINDRGPYKRGRIIDLTKKGAKELEFLKHGLTTVKVEVLELPKKNRKRT